MLKELRTSSTRAIFTSVAFGVYLFGLRKSCFEHLITAEPQNATATQLAEFSTKILIQAPNNVAGSSSLHLRIAVLSTIWFTAFSTCCRVSALRCFGAALLVFDHLGCKLTVQSNFFTFPTTLCRYFRRRHSPPVVSVVA